MIPVAWATTWDHVEDPWAMLLLEPCQSGWPSLLPGAMMIARPGLLPGIMSDSTILLQPRSVLISLAQVATKGHIKPGV